MIGRETVHCVLSKQTIIRWIVFELKNSDYKVDVGEATTSQRDQLIKFKLNLCND